MRRRVAARGCRTLRGIAATATLAGALAAMTATAAAAEITPALDAEVASAGPTDRIPVIAVLSDRVDGERFAGSDAALLRTLRERAGRSQPAVLRAAGIAIGRDDLERYWLVNALALDATPEEIAALADAPGVDRVTLDPVVRVVDGPQVETMAASSPGFGNWGVAAIRADEVWSQYGLTGAGVLVGSIDTGVTANSPAIAGKVARWRDFINGATAPYDDNGHGTHTIGTMVGGATTGAPVGVAPKARVIVAKAIAANGVAPGSQLLQAAQWMTDPDGDPNTADHPQVINNSWAASDPNDAWFRSMVRVWRGLDIVPVFAAGNSGPQAGTIGSPASYPETIAVGALDSPTVVASYSSRGPIAWQNRDDQGPAAGTQIVKPDLAAPGTDILSSYGDGYESFSGTSMASPHVAGAAALLKQAVPGATPDQIAQALSASAADIAPAGFDAQSGAGLIDVMGAAAAITGIPAGQIDARLTRRPASPTRASTLAYRVALINAPAYQVRVDGGAWGPLRYGTSFRLRLHQGRHTVRVRAVSISGDGRVDRAPARHAVVVDRERPDTRLRWSPADRRVVLRANAVDRLSGVRRIVWRLGDGRTATGRVVRHRYRDTRSRLVRLAVTDRAGNIRRIAHTVTPRTPTIARLTVSARVSAGAARLPIALRLIQPGRLRVSLARISNEPLLAGGRVALTTGRIILRGRSGTVRASLGVRRLAPGTYRLRAEVLGPAGRGEPPVERTVRILA